MSFHRCPVCHAAPSAADAAQLDELGEGLIVCPRDPWCWCAHAATDGDGLCMTCGLVVQRRTPTPYHPRETAQAAPPPIKAAPRPPVKPTYKQCTEKTCKARVIFATTRAGSQMIVDADPAEDGNVVIRWDSEAGIFRARIAQPGLTIEPDEVRHHTHFTTCKKPNQFRRKK